MAIDSLACAVFDFSTCCQNGVQPRNCPRLGHFRDTLLIYHTWQAYERLKQDDTLMPGVRTPDRGVGPSGAQMLNNLRLLPSALLQTSPLRNSLIHLNLNGCQSINKSAIDALLRLTHCHLPKLQRIHMEGLRLELCQQAAKSFLREKLNKLDSVGTMGAFTLGPTGVALLNGERDGHTLGQDLTAAHLTQWLRENSLDSQTHTYRATTNGCRDRQPWVINGHKTHTPDSRKACQAIAFYDDFIRQRSQPIIDQTVIGCKNPPPQEA